MKNLLIVSATKTEIEPFRSIAQDCAIAVTGVGMVETGASLTKIICANKPDFVVMAGIAGTYTDSGLDVGRCVVIQREIVADLGVMFDDGFKPMFQKIYESPEAERIAKILSLPLVWSNCVNMATSPYIAKSPEYQIENMEGAAFFAVCKALDVSFVEIRAVSNTVSTDRKDWNIPLATQNLAKVLQRLTKHENL